MQSYQANKKRFIASVQQALDDGVENYFAGLAKNNIYVLSDTMVDTLGKGWSGAFATRLQNVDSVANFGYSRIDIEGAELTHVWSGDQREDSLALDSIISTHSGNNLRRFRIKNRVLDSGRVRQLQFLTQKVLVSISEEFLELEKLLPMVEQELKNKQLDINFKLRQEVPGKKLVLGDLKGNERFLTAQSNSNYLRDFQNLSIDFENATLIILKHGLTELLLSILLIGLVVGTMIHLYRTISAQKQLAAIKDDLISNITHEFKTPISTIFSALEGVTSFNESNDPEKTKRYLALSNDQLHKLNNMVEKMLETATIDQGKLTLAKEDVELVGLTKSLVERFQMVEKHKEISFNTDIGSFVASVDGFHVENVLSNLIDNAIKYGGDKISISLRRVDDKAQWEVMDNGGNIPKKQQEKVFDKLYRIPTGNQHDVKGFGIGLYYARTIAELHEGSLTLEVSQDQTVFRLSI
ncbi:MAG: hypothetical protein Tsb0034_17100 [Ekhidna sp.]